LPGDRPGGDRAGNRRGLTLIEIAVAMTVLVFALLGFSQAMVGSSTSTQATHEVSLATQAGRRMIETLQGAEFTEVFALYNSTGADDPDGPDTAPGPRFAVAGLDPHPDDADGFVGEIVFPEGNVAGQLREDTVNARIGMPRDLDGDELVTAADCADTYSILPVLVRLEWLGKGGRGLLEFKTILVSY
jgi:type II secretory pathway pseudopilin PulG